MTMTDRFLDAFAQAASESTTDKARACCTFAERVTKLMYGAEVIAKAPGSLWNLWPDSGNAWGPVSACKLAGIVDHTRIDELNPGVYRVQGWRGTPFAAGVTGHTVTVLVPAGADAHGFVYVYDSAAHDRAGNVRGPKVQLVRWLDYSAQYKGGIASCRLVEV